MVGTYPPSRAISDRRFQKTSSLLLSMAHSSQEFQVSAHFGYCAAMVQYFYKSAEYILAVGSLSVAAESMHALPIPASRLTDWSPGISVGVPGGIPTNRNRVIDVTLSPYNADNSGVMDSRSAIQSAIDTSGAGDVVYLPAGTYYVNGTLIFDHTRDNRTLRGAGMAKTTIDFRGSKSGIYVGTSSDWTWSYPANDNIITSGVMKGSGRVSVANTTAFAVGAIAQLSFADTPDDPHQPVLHVSNRKTHNRHQKVIITGKTVTSLSFFPKLYANYPTANAKIHAARSQTDSVGIEALTLDCSNGAATYGIQFEQAYASWIMDVRIVRAKNYGVFFYDSLQCELRHSHLDEIKSSSTNGAGFLMHATSGSLIEDNIVYKAFPLMEINFSSAGNVFAYNFCEDSSVRGEVGAGINVNHGPHNSFNLYEGNIAPNVQADGYFGSVSDDTIFRNWLHGTVPGVLGAREPILLNRFTRNYSVVGNLLGRPGVSYVSIGGSP